MITAVMLLFQPRKTTSIDFSFNNFPDIELCVKSACSCKLGLLRLSCLAEPQDQKYLNT